MVFVYQHVGGLNSYDRVVLAPVNIFFECIKEGLSNREKGGCPLTAIPGSAPITQFREESVVGHWIPSDLENV